MQRHTYGCRCMLFYCPYLCLIGSGWRHVLRRFLCYRFIFFFRNECNMCDFQFITGFRFFPPGFPIYPKNKRVFADRLFIGANKRDIRGFYNILNINYLYLRDNLSFWEKHNFEMRNGPFQGPKSTISHPNIGFFAGWNRLFRKAKLIFSDYVTGYIKRRFGAKWPILCMF